jgi:hypothetical protein
MTTLELTEDTDPPFERLHVVLVTKKQHHKCQLFFYRIAFIFYSIKLQLRILASLLANHNCYKIIFFTVFHT